MTDPGWSWEATATIIQAVATIVALGGVAVTFFFSYRAERRERVRAQAEAARGREEAERADAAAGRSERAAALSIDTMGRIAEAIEALADRELGAPSLVAPPSRVKWSLTHFGGDTYMLRNVGDAVAYRVRVTADESLMMPEELPPVSDLRPGDNVTFMTAITFDTRDTTISVEWSASEDDDGERDVWRYPLPPRPARS